MIRQSEMLESNLHEIDSSFMVEKRRRPIDFAMPKEHYHRHYEIFYLLTGKCRMFLNHTLYDVEPGMFLLIEPFAIHRSSYGLTQESERIAISFDEKYLQRFDQVCGQGALRRLFDRHEIGVEPGRRQYSEQLLQKLVAEQAVNDPYSELMKHNYLLELIVFLSRYSEHSGDRRLSAESEPIISQAAEYIFNHYAEPLTLADIAQRFHLSPSYFSRKFQRITGFGYKEYLSHVRLKEASRMLLETNESITDIAMKCGFSDANYFGDFFKKEKGISPGRYRKNPQIY